MGRDFTTSSASRQDSGSNLLPEASWRLGDISLLDVGRFLVAMAVGALLIALAYQIPVTHTVDIGGYDAAYTQGFFDPERDSPAAPRPELVGSDGSARWTGASSFLLFPQAGLPAQLTVRLRGWRTSGPPPEVTLLLNGTQSLGSFRASNDWQEHTFTINGGLLKPNDVVIEIRSETAQLDSGDPRAVGVLLDRATFHAGPAPIIPYPPQLFYGALAAGMLYILIGKNKERAPAGSTENTRSSILRTVLGAFVLCLLFFVLYRSQPFYPYPLLRLLPVVDGGLAVLLALRYGPRLAWRAPALLDALALGGVGVWLAAVLVGAQQHVTLSLPSVEGDFRVFALRSAHLIGQFPAGTTSPDADGVLRADGFYNLGYPLLLWFARPLTSDNAFLAGRLVAALSGALLLLACWWLARRLLGRGGALLALFMLALSPLVVEYALYVGTDMPFAAACALALALLIPVGDWRLEIGDYKHKQFVMLVAAGIAVGAAFLIRHPGLLLVPIGWLVIWLQHDRAVVASSQSRWQRLRFSIFNVQFSIFTLAFLITVSPQLYVNVRDTGQPFYSQQAKNIWQGVFGDGDWGRWAATANDITLGRVIAQDPPRFLANWWANIRGYFGTGGEDIREFGQATQLRLLGFPANWLAIAGLLGWLFAEGKRQKAKGKSEEDKSEEGKRQKAKGKSADDAFATFYLLPFTFCLTWLAFYVLTVSVGLAPQARFFLPLAPVYALAAAWVVVQLRPAPGDSGANPLYAARGARYQIIAGIALLVVLWGGFATGAGYVTRTRLQFGDTMPGQPPDEVAAALLVQSRLRGDDRLVLQPPRDSIDGIALGKYSAIADRVVPAPPSDDLAALRATGAGYLLRATLLGPAPGDLAVVASAGGYTLYIIK